MNKWRLIERMDKLGYSQVKLAKEIGMSKNAFNNKINGHSSFDTVEAESICNKLCISEMKERAEIFLS